MKKRFKRVLLLTNYYIYGFSVHSNAVTRDVKIDLSTDFLEQAREYLLQDSSRPTRIITNVLEEEFHFDSTPHISGVDRKNLLNRKLQQHFKQSDLKRYVVQGRSRFGRRDDEVMFSSLGGSSELHTLIDLMHSTKTPITGILSAPQLCKTYLDILINDRDVLIMSEIDNGRPDRVAVRQSFFKAGQLKLTRVGMIEVISPETIKQDVESELESSRQYLLRERHIREDDQLEVVFISSTGYLSRLSTHSDKMARHFAFKHIGTSELAAALGVNSTTGETGFEEIVVAKSFASFQRTHYSSPRSNFVYKHFAARKYAIQGSIAASLLFTSSAAYFGMSGLEKQFEQTNKLAMYERVRRNVQTRKSKVNHLPEDIYQVKMAVDMVETTELGSIEPINVYGIVSRGLQAFPDFEVTDIEWSKQARAPIAGQQALSDSDDGDYYGDSNGDNYSDNYSDNSNDNYDSWEEEERKQQYAVVVIEGKPVGYAGNVRKMLDDLNALAGLYNGDARVAETNLLTLPVKVNPEAELSGQVVSGSTENVQVEEKFKLELVLDHAAS